MSHAQEAAVEVELPKTRPNNPCHVSHRSRLDRQSQRHRCGIDAQHDSLQTLPLEVEDLVDVPNPATVADRGHLVLVFSPHGGGEHELPERAGHGVVYGVWRHLHKVHGASIEGNRGYPGGSKAGLDDFPGQRTKGPFERNGRNTRKEAQDVLKAIDVFVYVERAYMSQVPATKPIVASSAFERLEDVPSKMTYGFWGLSRRAPFVWKMAYIPLAMGEQRGESEVPKPTRRQREIVKRTPFRVQFISYEKEDVHIDSLDSNIRRLNP